MFQEPQIPRKTLVKDRFLPITMQNHTAKDTFFSKNRSLNCRGKILSLERPRIMGILNITPDSFYDGGWYVDPEKAFERAGAMIQEGADILDIGAASSRPGADIIEPQTELERLKPVVSRIRKAYPDAILSIDTYSSIVATEMINSFEVDMINDISAGEIDPDMTGVIADANVPYLIMHMKGLPGNMQDNPVYENVTDEIIQYFAEKVYQLHKKGVSDILIDPGFGFGKKIEHNYTLLAQFDAFRMFELPVVAGISRKSMIYNFLNSTKEKALAGTTAAHMVLLEKGVNILRVHDVRETREAIAIFNEVRKKRS